MAYDWAVVGAGPAGIAAVGKLLDQGIAPEKILWIDPHFTAGDFGTLWRGVPSNTKVKLFLKFLNDCKSFNYANANVAFALNQANPEETCLLGLMADPLQWVSDHLKTKVHTRADLAENVSLHKRHWTISFKQTANVVAKNVILATGAEAKTLTYPTVETLPLPIAIDEEKIKSHITPEDNIAVFGSSHSAMLVIKNLLACEPQKIINFFRTPLRYAVYLKDWILFDDTGLKGPTAAWAREHIDGEQPKKLTRIYSNAENIEEYLPQCSKVVYAVGFEKRSSPTISGFVHHDYIEQCGIIAPGLFGLGIAFPEVKLNPLGITEYRVGLWKFMDYLNKILPIWLGYHA